MRGEECLEGERELVGGGGGGEERRKKERGEGEGEREGGGRVGRRTGEKRWVYIREKGGGRE